jgi:hypothetical protein
VEKLQCNHDEQSVTEAGTYSVLEKIFGLEGEIPVD